MNLSQSNRNGANITLYICQAKLIPTANILHEVYAHITCTVTVTRKIFEFISSSDGLMVYAYGRYVLWVSEIID